MSIESIPLFQRLERSERVILAGVGGGYDVYCALPLYFHLRQRGKEVFLVSLSFSDFRRISGRAVTTATVEVNASSQGPPDYFPEGDLCKWFQQRGEAVSIYCISPNGVIPLRTAYSKILQETGADTIVAVDGGTDSLMRGDEVGLGTPNEDLATLAAVADLPVVQQKLLVCIGFGVDAFHGVCHAQVLEAVAALTRTGDYLGCVSLTPEQPEVQAYMEAVDFVAQISPHHPSIVNASIVSAMEGRYGDYHRTHRTAGWLGEFGEKTQSWQVKMITLMETHGVGWALYPWKRKQTLFWNPVLQRIPDSFKWYKVAKYLAQNAKMTVAVPSKTDAEAGMTEILSNVKLSKCLEDKKLAQAIIINN